MTASITEMRRVQRLYAPAASIIPWVTWSYGFSAGPVCRYTFLNSMNAQLQLSTPAAAGVDAVIFWGSNTVAKNESAAIAAYIEANMSASLKQYAQCGEVEAPREKARALSTRASGPTALELLQALPALPRPHYSWPFCHLENSCTDDFMRTALPWSDPLVMREFARITHSLSTYAAVDSSEADSDTMWEKLVAGVAGTDATIAIQLETGTDAHMLSQLRTATTALARANKKLGLNASIGCVMVDQESHWGTWNTTIITARNDAVH